MSKPRPNIVLLMVDQLAASALAAYGHPLVKTPHIDSIAKRGAVFENFYSNFPLCAPARLALMTGKLCSNIQAWDNAAQIPGRYSDIRPLSPGSWLPHLPVRQNAFHRARPVAWL